MAPGFSWALFGWAMRSLTSIVYHWTSWSSLSYNQVSVSELTFGSMSSKGHQTRIALSEPMTGIVQQGLSLSSSMTSPSLNTHFKSTFVSLTLCQVLPYGRQRQINWRIYSSPAFQGQGQIRDWIAPCFSWATFGWTMMPLTSIV